MGNKRININKLSATKRTALLQKLKDRKQKRKDFSFPLSYGQRAIWYSQKLFPESALYNLALGFGLLSNIDFQALRKAFQWIIELHPAFRTVFTEVDGIVSQRILQAQKIKFQMVEVAHLSEKHLQEIIDKEAARIFNLEKGPLFYVIIYHGRPGRHVMLINCHHIIADMWSFTLVLDQLGILYEAAVTGQKNPITPQTTDFSNFVSWQHDLLDSPEGNKLWGFWQKQLQGNLRPVEIITDYPRDRQRRFDGQSYPFRFDKQVTSGIRQLSSENKLTLQAVLMAGFSTLLFNHSGQDTFMLRTLVAGRSKTAFEQVAGFFANPVFVRTECNSKMSFNELMVQTQRTLARVIEHQDFPFECMMERVKFGQGLGYNPMSQVQFILQAPHRFLSTRKTPQRLAQYGVFYPGRSGIVVNLQGLIMEFFNPTRRTVLNDIDIELAEAGNEISGVIRFRTDLYKPQSISRMVEDFQELLTVASNKPDTPLSQMCKSNKRQGVGRTEKSHTSNTSLKISSNPETETEKRLVKLWQMVLGLEKVGVTDNFYELGGQSLLSLQLATLIIKEFGQTIPLPELLSAYTIRQQAIIITKQSTSEAMLIQRQTKRTNLPLSFAQERLFFLDILNTDSASYNIPIAAEIKGVIRPASLESALNKIISRHESLRSTFFLSNGRPYQKIHRNVFLPVSLEKVVSRDIDDLFHRKGDRPFNLNSEIPIRAHLLQISETLHYFVLVVHHIVADARSLFILLEEMIANLVADNSYLPAPLAELDIQYADYAVWQRQYFDTESQQANLEYWREKLSNIKPINFWHDLQRTPVQEFTNELLQFRLETHEVALLRRLASENSTSLFTVLLTIFSILLHRFSGEEDLLIGVPFSLRENPQLENLIGCFLNILPIRIDLQTQTTFLQLLQQVHQTVEEAKAHRHTPFEKLVELSGVERDLSREPLFQVMLAYQEEEISQVKLPGGLLITPMNIPRGTTRYDLTAFFNPSSDGAYVTFEFDASLFYKSTIEQLAATFRHLIKTIPSHSTKNIASLTLQKPSLSHGVLKGDIIHNHLQYNVLQLFDHQVQNTPSTTVVVDAVSSVPLLSFAELDQSANQISHLLQAKGVAIGDIVCISMERSPLLLPSILGILKAGAAFLPIDTTWPAKRVSAIITKSESGHFVTDRVDNQFCQKKSRVKLHVISDEQDFAGQPKLPLKIPVTQQDPAYYIFTSGTSGNPKGIKITHGALAHYLSWAKESYDVQQGDSMLLFGSIAFDMTITSLFGPLVWGGSIRLAPAGETEMWKSLSAESINQTHIIKLTPSLAVTLGKHLLPGGILKTLILGGEEMRWEHVSAWRHIFPQLQIFNEYGPTEATVGCSCYRLPSSLPKAGRVPIGQPIANTILYNLDKQLRPLPHGFPGELYISGAGLADGYLNDQESSDLAFIDNPFSNGKNKLFASGDTVRQLSNDDMEYLGRSNNQIKLRGYRIELDEIETLITNHPNVKKTVAGVVTTRQQPPFLEALFVANGTEPTEDELKIFLRQKLPSYMIPLRIIAVPELPIDPSHKVNRKCISLVEVNETHCQFEADGDNIDQYLRSIWKQFAPVQTTDPRSNFFASGGTSLIALQLIAAIEEVTGISLPLIDFFRDPTLAGLKRMLNTATTDMIAGSAVLIPLNSSSRQNTIYCIHAAGGGVSCYHHLAHALTADCRVVAIQSKAISQPQIEYRTIDEMAAEYAVLIKNETDGPVHLLGWSLGAEIAMAVAAHLQNDSRDVDFLGLLEPLGQLSTEKHHLLEWLQDIARQTGFETAKNTIKSIAKLDLEQLVTHSLEEINSVIEDAFVSIKEMIPDDTYNTFLNTMILAVLHQKMIRESSQYSPPDSAWIWYVQDHVSVSRKQVSVAKGNHFTMLQPPNIAAIAADIRKILMTVRQ